MTNTHMGDVYRQEVIALRAELARRDGPPPVPSLAYYADDAEALIHTIERRGIHPSEARDVIDVILDLLDRLDQQDGIGDPDLHYEPWVDADTD